MSSRLQMLTKPIAAKFSSPIFGKESSRSTELEDAKRFENFAHNLTSELRNLKPADGESALRLRWLQRIVTLAQKEHEDVLDLIPKVKLPLSKVDEAWISEYMDTTTAVLDICNSLKASMSNVEHGHLLVKYAICILEKHAVSPEATYLTRARNSLQEWIEAVRHAQEFSKLSWAEPKDHHARLQGMLNDLKLFPERAPAKRKGLLEALHGAQTTDVLACTALTIGLSGKSDFSFPEVTPHNFTWASSATHLFQHCRSEAREKIANGLSGRAEEIEDANYAVQKLVKLLGERSRFSLSREETDEIRGAVEELKSRSGVLESESEKLMEKVDDFVRSIINGRSALLANMQASVASAYSKAQNKHTAASCSQDQRELRVKKKTILPMCSLRP